MVSHEYRRGPFVSLSQLLLTAKMPFFRKKSKISMCHRLFYQPIRTGNVFSSNNTTKFTYNTIKHDQMIVLI